MDIITQARLPVYEQRKYLYTKYYDIAMSLVPKELINQKDIFTFIDGYIEQFVFYPTGLMFWARINRNGTVVDLYRNCVCDIIQTQDYSTVTVFDGKKSITMYLHRLLAYVFIQLPEGLGPNTHDVNHKDLNKLNYNIDNLEWCTRSENMNHAIANNCYYTVPIQITYPCGKIESATSIEEASRKTNINSATIFYRLKFINKILGDGFKFDYMDNRVVPKHLGISVVDGIFKQNGIPIVGVSKMHDLYNRFPELTLPEKSYKRIYMSVVDNVGNKKIYTSMRKLEEEIGISRKYLKKWLTKEKGVLTWNNYQITWST